MFDFNKPNIEITEISEDKKYGRFVVEPLERGYGTTLGNSLRRIMLSSLPGTAISKVKICLLYTSALNENESITHDFIGKFGGASVLLKTAPEGTGVIAGGPARAVIEMAGIKNIRTKSLGSNNKQNVVLATIEGLRQIKTPEEVSRLRGKSIEEILG